MNPTAIIATRTAKDAPCCFCGMPSTDPHHIIGGSGKRKPLDDAWNIVRVCRLCHDWIEDTWAIREAFRRDLQKDLREWLPDEYICDRPEWIKEKVWWGLIKKLTWDEWGCGYRTEDLIKQMLGGRWY